MTLAQLVDVTGPARNVAAQTDDPLVARGILIEEMGKNSMGRGMARQFQIAPAVLEAVAPLMGEPIGRSKTKAET
ncbi:hypothetical protein [Ensifer adhaerens]|uniref:hypothetical protein n=1 Tax=Ensifer adhaerens TaxID=106592 RepID=UPI001CBE7412|nr:hypothetical protein [Ensifer adhaerens]MBZ7927125.1 hypothetical protein [Ensifer adhaerens]